ncbi:hypothetical protein HKX48_008112 [Thoreauomyces humboldtii]|nr:hypothetical protein HKX48_008112 [Thoreauomyces humboldtii]
MGAPKPDHEVIEIHELRTCPSSDIPVAAIADEKYLAYHHLSGDEAQRRLLAAADEVLANHRLEATDAVTTTMVKQSTIVTVVAGLGLVAFFISVKIQSSPYQWRATGALVEAFLLLLALVWNMWLQVRESRLTAMEMSMRIQSIVEPLRKYGLSRKPDLKLPTSIATVSLSRVVRDQVVLTLPFNLIVTDDIVQMAYGDTAPCKVKYVNSHFDIAPGTEEREYILEKGQLFRPTLFSSPPDRTIMRRAALNEGQFHFRALETPLKDTLKKALDFNRPETVVLRQFAIIADYYFTRLMWGFLAISCLVNALRYGIRDTSTQEKKQQGVEILLVIQIYVILPLLPLVLPTLFIIIRSFGNAQILSLFDALQTSKTEFEDREDIDEFDAAPPPTKDLVLDWGAPSSVYLFSMLLHSQMASPGLVWKRFLDQFVHIDVSFLARTTGLVASLASTTVICAIDREGTISLPTPSVEQLFFLDAEGDPVVLDIAEDTTDHILQFEDRDWQQNIASLKPLGLELLLNTDCGAANGRVRLEHHRKANGHQHHGRIKPGRQACLCQMGKEIGFSSDVVRSFALQKTIHVFAPFHQQVTQVPDYHFEVPSYLSQIYQEVTTKSFQLFSEGNVNLVLESCGDYWNGTELETLNETAQKKIHDFCQNALINDAQVVGYSYRPIENTKTLPFTAADAHHAPSEPVYIEFQVQNDDLSASASISSLAGSDSPASGRSTKPRKRYLNNIDRVRTPQGFEVKQFCSDLIKGQTFLGLASLAYQPKANVADFIEDLGLGGIRFVYFSSAPERESKAYAERLGLEIDWNSCILLSSDNGDTPGYLEEHDMKAKLPRGVDKIRDHIRDVDDVPLHVSLFAECSPRSIIEMVRIFQEQGEVVCCIGSSLNEMNVECFSLADVSIAIDPLSALKSRNHPPTGPLSPLSLGAAFASSPCAFSLHSDTSIYSLSQIIRDARTISDSGRQAIAFYLGCQTSLPFIMILASCMLLPPVFTGYQLMWLLWVVLPPLTLSFMFSPYDPHIMTRMPAKNTAHLKDKWRFVSYFVARFIAPILVSIGVFAVTLSEFNGEASDVTQAFGNFGNGSWMRLTDREQWALLYAQNCTMFVWVVLMVTVSASFLHRTDSLLRRPPWHNRVWVLAALTSIALQAVFMAVSVAPRSVYSLSVVKWWAYVVALVAAPAISIALQELVKVHDRRAWEKFQKRSKLEFNTKLGMHSPL